MKKGSLMVHEYLKKMNDVVDALIASGQNVIKGELISCILDGTGPEFDQAGGVSLGDAKIILWRHMQMQIGLEI